MFSREPVQCWQKCDWHNVRSYLFFNVQKFWTRISDSVCNELYSWYCINNKVHKAGHCTCPSEFQATFGVHVSHIWKCKASEEQQRIFSLNKPAPFSLEIWFHQLNISLYLTSFMISVCTISVKNFNISFWIPLLVYIKTHSLAK